MCILALLNNFIYFSGLTEPLGKHFSCALLTVLLWCLKVQILLTNDEKKRNSYYINLTLVLLQICPAFANYVNPDQLASEVEVF